MKYSSRTSRKQRGGIWNPFRSKKTEKSNAEKEVERAKEFAKRLEASEEWKKKEKKKEKKRNKNAASLKTNKPKKGVFAGIKDLFSRKKKNLKYYPPVAAFNARANPINIKPFSFNNTKSASKKTSASKTKKRDANASPSINNADFEWNMLPMSAKKSLAKSKSATRKQGPSKEMQKILNSMPKKSQTQKNLEGLFMSPITRKRPVNVMSPGSLLTVANSNGVNWNLTNVSNAFKSKNPSLPKKGVNAAKLLELTQKIENLQKEVKQLYNSSIQGIVRNSKGNPIGFTKVGSYYRR